jgi:5-methyltetrahydrofolate corrinoid/iron sulfur protein methyltransferase
MLLIGESLNVISKKIGRAFKERDPNPIQEEALFQRGKGMDYIDINLGPAKKDGVELMPWVVKTVQEVVDDVPLALDSSNIDAIEAALKVIKPVPSGLSHIVNSIMVRPERYERMVPMTADAGADFVALMWRLRDFRGMKTSAPRCVSSCFILPTRPASPMRKSGWTAS